MCRMLCFLVLFLPLLTHSSEKFVATPDYQTKWEKIGRPKIYLSYHALSAQAMMQVADAIVIASLSNIRRNEETYPQRFLTGKGWFIEYPDKPNPWDMADLSVEETLVGTIPESATLTILRDFPWADLLEEEQKYLLILAQDDLTPTFFFPTNFGASIFKITEDMDGNTGAHSLTEKVIDESSWTKGGNFHDIQELTSLESLRELANSEKRRRGK